eukprot:792853-Alexandrium_andersonii.AAC.1
MRSLDISGVSHSSNFRFMEFRVQATSEIAKWLYAFEPGTARAQEGPQNRSPRPLKGVYIAVGTFAELRARQTSTHG